ncbi:MAG: [Protein-PII] uridylyltransferase (EC 2.7.7.59) / [Protein-PII]-UMP uridylyl-removing enzyme [Olavius algarvensis Delta 4 endosymbiont]|nr:MAG: [Protein-PII] uridylyltransferase (EC 2.7.7.59) / [Protein-PII]-UMP uridylyl-removing enzyme [Olavius algarvensis Delta 4 endosymbiont]
MQLTQMKSNYSQTSLELLEDRKQLTTRFLRNEEPDYLVDNARLLDNYFRESFAGSVIGPRIGILKNPYTIIALGGYGRQEQCTHSDVDLLFLFEKRVPPEAEELIREVVYPLWDIGLDVGHATQSLKECLKLASQDYEVLTSLLDARFICGISPLYTKLLERLRNTVLKQHSRRIIDWLIESNETRHVRFGDSAGLLQPNLKEGLGGLRDYHTMLWIAKIKSGAQQVRDLEYYGYLSHAEFSEFFRSLAFIWSIRNRLHILTGRKCDQLYFSHQEKLAAEMAYQPEQGQQPVELFLGELHGHMEQVKQQHQMFLHELGGGSARRKRRRPIKTTTVNGLTVAKNNTLGFTSPETILGTPELLIEIFAESARLKIPPGIEARRLVKDFLHLVDDRFFASGQAVKSFEKILTTAVPQFNVLNEMMTTGLLTALLPEVQTIANRIQYDEYHTYPVDKHSLEVVQTVKAFGSKNSPVNDQLCVSLYKEMKHRKMLMWAALLHDIGKGQPGKGHARKGAEIAASILTRFGYRPKDIDTVIFLVREHLLLVKTATRRDLNDEGTAIACARKIEDVLRLKMLYLLSVADSIATGPKAWNDWTAALLRASFFRVLNILKGGELASREAIRTVDAKKTALLELAEPARRPDIDKLFNFMSPRYLLYADPEAMRKHVDIYVQLGQRPFVWKIEESEDGATRTVTICAQDRPGLFSKIAGVFTLHGINILDVQVFTWKNNIALDIFKVQPPPDQLFEKETWQKAAAVLEKALAAEFELDTAIAARAIPRTNIHGPVTWRPTEINVDNEASNYFTIIEIFTYDAPGLLFTITDTLFKCGLDVWVAKIATQVDQVADIFYVRDIDGQKVDDPEEVENLKKQISLVLTEIENRNSGRQDQTADAQPGGENEKN